MAYPTLDGPYGFKPVRLLGGQPYAGATTMYPISSSEGTAIFTGDVVTLNDAGQITKQAATNSGSVIVGVFMGCSYTNATTGQKVFAQYAPATPPADTVAYVVDDPQVVFKAAVCTAGATTLNGVLRTAVGNTAAIVLNAGSTATGNSKFAVNAATATTTTLPLKVIDVIPETANASGSSTEVLVIFNPTCHFMTNSGAV